MELPHSSTKTARKETEIHQKSPTQFSKIMIFVFHPTHHQVTKSRKNTKITKLGLAPTMPRSIPLSPKLFPHHFGGICEV